MRKSFASLSIALATLVTAAPSAAADPDSLQSLYLDNVPARYQQLLEMTPAKPLPIYVEIDEEQAATVPMFAPGDPLTIYLNRWGGTFYGGADDSSTNYSSIVNGTSATIDPFPGSDGQWNEVKSCVTDLFSRFNLIITDIEPTSGDYVEAVLAGSPTDIGMPWGVGGVAPFDPYSCGVLSNSIVYAFAESYIGGGWGGERALCETAAQEIAHAFGLDHELLCEDPMTYLDGCGAKEFQDVYAACGEYEERECSCNRSSQNSVQEMYEKLGASNGAEPPPPPNDLEDPKVALLSPEDGEALVGNDLVEIVATATDDIGLVSVSLDWEFSDAALPCPGEGGGWSCSREGATHRWLVQVGLGSRSFSVSARDVMGKTVTSERRTIWLSEDGSPAPEDNYDPEVRIVTPSDGSVLPAEETIVVVATASDDVGIASVELDWVWSGVSFPCPYESRRVTCEQNGSTYIWEVSVGDGARTFSVRATDMLGKVTETAQRTVTLQYGAPNPVVDNDTYDLATELECGDAARVAATPGEESWFEVNTPEGERVRVEVSGDVADNLQVTASTGSHSSQIMADAEGDPALMYTTPAEEDVRVRVRPTTESGEYRIEVQCLPPYEAPEMYQPPTAAGCSASTVAGDGEMTPPTTLALIGLLSLIAVRRRKTKLK
jgi:hypothetical protein